MRTVYVSHALVSGTFRDRYAGHTMKAATGTRVKDSFRKVIKRPRGRPAERQWRAREIPPMSRLASVSGATLAIRQSRCPPVLAAPG